MGRVHKRIVMNSERIDLALRRMAQQIIEVNPGLKNVALIGIADGGVPVTNRLRALLKQIGGLEVPLGMIDITLYRDDLHINDQPELKSTQIDFDIDGLTIILVDDVLFTGRTVRAAISSLFDYGRPGRIQLAILIDRQHRELPIRADFIGKYLDTDRDQKVLVNVADELDSNADKVVLITSINDEDA